MVTIPTNARTTVRAKFPQDVEVSAWTVEFTTTGLDSVRLYSVDGQPDVILVETADEEGDLTLTCHLGLHGIDRRADGREYRRRGKVAGSLELTVDASTGEVDEVEFNIV